VKHPTPDLRRIFQTLAEHHVDFIVVGGVCAVLHGAPINTFDLDVVHSRDASNIDRLLAALGSLGARYRTEGKQSFAPDRSHLASAGHQLLMTGSGPLDLLGTIGNGHAYQDLVPETTVMEIGGGLTVRLLNLAALIRVKRETAQEKDKYQLAILERTAEEKAKK
jgi:hypothetical protein